MEEWLIILAVITLLLIFRNNKFMQAIIKIFIEIVTIIFIAIFGGVIGFFFGYSNNASVLGYKIPLDILFSDNPNFKFGDFILERIREKILISTIIGILLSVIIYIIAYYILKKKRALPTSIGIELEKLFELKEKGMISNDEFESLKKRIMN